MVRRRREAVPGHVRIATIVLSAIAVVAGCGGPGSTPRPAPPAEVATAGPDCLADQVLTGLGWTPLSVGHVGPSAGSVPAGFDPVRVVECRPPQLVLREPEMIPLPDLVGPEGELIASTGPEPPGNGSAADQGPASVQVVEVTLTGNLQPLLAALSRPSEPVPSDQVCPAMWESKPQIYLVDTDGHAIRPQWPVTACGFLHDGARETLAVLTEAGSTVRTAEVLAS